MRTATRIRDGEGKHHVGSARTAYGTERICHWLLGQVR